MVRREDPVYVLLLVGHVASAVIGFGTATLSGLYARVARGGGRDEASTGDYFRPGTNWLPRALYLVPPSGVALLRAGGGPLRPEAWLVASAAVWVGVVVLAEAVLWPAERRIQIMFSRPGGTTPPQSLDRACRRVELASILVAVGFVVALVLMVAKPTA